MAAAPGRLLPQSLPEAPDSPAATGCTDRYGGSMWNRLCGILAQETQIFKAPFATAVCQPWPPLRGLPAGGAGIVWSRLLRVWRGS